MTCANDMEFYFIIEILHISQFSLRCMQQKQAGQIYGPTEWFARLRASWGWRLLIGLLAVVSLDMAFTDVCNALDIVVVVAVYPIPITLVVLDQGRSSFRSHKYTHSILDLMQASNYRQQFVSRAEPTGVSVDTKLPQFKITETNN
uniref:Uncharacterized protein n=1 Tax=Glossina pallidipes TaxID=7398 RepID=A0A1A9ZD36_GLOPL